MLNENFPVVYKGTTYLVDPVQLSNSSRKFRELFEPFLERKSEASNIHLDIVECEFTDRNIENFLKLCQHLPTDVMDNEMEQICEIAKMFQAEEIYNTGVNFIRKNIDPRFTVPDDKYSDENGKTFLYISGNSTAVFHAGDLNNLEFDSSDNGFVGDEGMSREASTFDFHPHPDEQPQQHGEKSKEHVATVVYRIRVDVPAFKLVRFYFGKDGIETLAAKKHGNEIVIGKGTHIHINKDISNHIGKIVQGFKHSNTININNQTFTLSYIPNILTGCYSMQASFKNQGKQLDWSPKPPHYSAKHTKFYFNLGGMYHHKALVSRKNTVLQNSNGQATFIVRKIADCIYECECHPALEPEIVFALGISQIVGPFEDSDIFY